MGVHSELPAPRDGLEAQAAGADEEAALAAAAKPAAAQARLGSICEEAVVKAEAPADDMKPSDDALRMSKASTLQRVGIRMPAIIVTFCIEMVVAFVISQHHETLKRYPLLISFQPVVSAISGNVGLQSSAIVIRNLALGLTSAGRMRDSVWPETKVGLVMASITCCMVGFVAFSWYSPLAPDAASAHTWRGSVVFGGTVALGLFVSMMVGAVSGSLGPVFFKRLGFDPSAMAGPMETAIQDIVGGTLLLTLSQAILEAFGDHGAQCPGGDASGCMELCREAQVNATAALFSTPCVQRCIEHIVGGQC